MKNLGRLTTLISLLVITCPGTYATDTDYTVKLLTGEFTPDPVRSVASTSAGLQGRHILIQFENPLTEEDKSRLAGEGIELLNYVPHHTYTARLRGQITTEVLSDFGIRWFDALKPEQKLSPMITETGIGPWSYRGENRVEFSVILHKDEDAARWATILETDFDAEILDVLGSEFINILQVIVDEPMYYRLSELDAVMWIEPAMPDPVEFNNGSRANTRAAEAQLPPLNLLGTGIVVAEWDGGAVDRYHADFDNRVSNLDGSNISTHATHVAGTVLGSGYESGGTYRGMAPDARLLSLLWWGTNSELTSEYSTVINSRGASISTNSWGYGTGDPATVAACEDVLGTYIGKDVLLDNIVRGSQGAPITIVWSAGNARSHASDECGSLGYEYGTIKSLACSKNVISVGAIWDHNSSMTSFSSWGPTDDGRLKPDVVGPGCTTTSTQPGTGYTNMCGTSMSAPAVAGVSALLYEQFYREIGTTVLPSTIKGILINTAVDLGRPGPDYSFGHGRVDAVVAATKIGIGEPSFVEGTISTGNSQIYDVTVTGSDTILKVTLIWDDPGGITSVSQNLINDLDLTLVDPFGVESYPWILDPASPETNATRGEDHLNNIETVEIDNPTAGLWTAVVSGTNIPEGPQAYSLIFTPDSAHTPGAQIAVAAYDGADLNADPGTTASAEFWVSNVGAALDSLRVQITDDALWLASTVDTSIVLNSHDSAHFVVPVDLPAEALVDEQTTVTCRVNSLTNTAAVDIANLTVTTNARYEVALSSLPEDTVGSPDSFAFELTVTNNGNTPDVVVITGTDERGWSFDPPSHTKSLALGGSTDFAFTISVPAEVPHLSENVISVIAQTQGDYADTSSFSLIADNAIFPPSLVSPEPTVYTQQRLHSFSWDDPGADSYTLYIATDYEITSPVRTYGGITDLSFDMPQGDSLTDDTYYWAVRKYIGSDSSSLQLTPGQLVVDNKAPFEVIPESPIDSAYKANTTFSLTFSEIGGEGPNGDAPEYGLLQIAQDVTFTTELISIDSISGFSVPAPASLTDGRWYWHVRRFDLAGNVASFSAPISFVIDTETPPIPTPLLPEDGFLTDADSVTLIWGTDEPRPWDESPERYYLHVSNRPDFIDFDTYQGYVYDTVKVLPSSLLELGRTYYWRMRAFDEATHATAYSDALSFDFKSFICGDADGNGTDPDIGDLTYLINYLFIDGPAPDPYISGSVDCNEIIDIGDITALIGYLFIAGDEPCCL
ncbi:MAG: S8 family serine peptidase [Candidatus Zixiibacteriota bacterium]|nr:MAG: S8 family serine peptidase [candidate division Zixibacteria bacterium]